MFQECFKGVSRMIEGHLKIVFKGLKGNKFKMVLRKFQMSFKKV